MSENVAILGASDKTTRYSFKAFKMLKDYGHKVYPVHPKLTQIENTKCFSTLSEIKDKIDTLTMYVTEDISNTLIDDILKLKPKRVIFNPGTENYTLEMKLKENGIAFEESCTLVLLSTGQY